MKQSGFLAMRANKARLSAIGRIESELLSALFKYAVPFIGKKIISRNKKQHNLENILNQKPRVDFTDINELESLLLNNLSQNAKAEKKTEMSFGSLRHSLALRRKKGNDEKSNRYSISIEYGENQSEDRLKISVKKDGKESYSSEIANPKEPNDKVAPYKVTITYEDRYGEERLSIAYRQQLNSYMKQHLKDKEDMSSRVPLKWLNILPENVMGGVLGFTYLGENFMGRRADLTGKTARMVDIHESIHTSDEYETRVLTSWIMEKGRGKYIK